VWLLAVARLAEKVGLSRRGAPLAAGRRWHPPNRKHSAPAKTSLLKPPLAWPQLGHSCALDAAAADRASPLIQLTSGSTCGSSGSSGGQSHAGAVGARGAAAGAAGPAPRPCGTGSGTSTPPCVAPREPQASARLSKVGSRQLCTEAMLKVLQQEIRNGRRRSFELRSCEEELVLDQPLGRGGYGAVYGGLWHGTPSAIKIMNARGSNSEAVSDAMEMAVLSSVQHPNIVQVYSCLTDMVRLADRERQPRGRLCANGCCRCRAGRALSSLPTCLSSAAAARFQGPRAAVPCAASTLARPRP
jgi:hypothetical protein